MVKVNVISGFLGAGKTTLIKKLLGSRIREEKVILLENEYGDVSVDGSFMKETGITVTELSNGCICCSLVGDLQKAIDDLIATYHPDRLLVEPSGVGKLSEIVAAVEKAKERHDLAITGCATVVDAMKCRMHIKSFGEFYIDQIKTADTVIFSRTQMMTTDKVEAARALVESHHPGVRIITTPWDDLTPDTMLEVIESGRPIIMHDEDCDCHEHHHHHDHDHDHDEDCDCHEHHHHHDHDHDHDEDCDCHEHHHHHDHDHDHDEDCDCHEHHHHHDHDHDHDEHCGCHEHHHHHHGHDADEVFTSIGAETARRYEQSDIAAMLDKLEDADTYGQILRAKGVLQNAAGEWFQFDYVPGEAQFRAGSADYTGRLCIIGSHIHESALRELFKL